MGLSADWAVEANKKEIIKRMVCMVNPRSRSPRVYRSASEPTQNLIRAKRPDTRPFSVNQRLFSVNGGAIKDLGTQSLTRHKALRSVRLITAKDRLTPSEP